MNYILHLDIIPRPVTARYTKSWKGVAVLAMIIVGMTFIVSLFLSLYFTTDSRNSVIVDTPVEAQQLELECTSVTGCYYVQEFDGVCADAIEPHVQPGIVQFSRDTYTVWTCKTDNTHQGAIIWSVFNTSDQFDVYGTFSISDFFRSPGSQEDKSPFPLPAVVPGKRTIVQVHRTRVLDIRSFHASVKRTTWDIRDSGSTLSEDLCPSPEFGVLCGSYTLLPTDQMTDELIARYYSFSTVWAAVSSTFTLLTLFARCVLSTKTSVETALV